MSKFGNAPAASPLVTPPTTRLSKTAFTDYSLTGVNATRAIERGLAEADWYQCPVPRSTLRRLLERRNGPAIRDTLLWFGLLAASGWAGYALWGSAWAILPFAVYGVIYASSSDSRWHESSHGTAFRTDWMNNALYEIASFMVLRESTPWRWSHTRHHSDTIIVGRDPEIAVPRPPDLVALLLGFFNLAAFPKYFRNVLLHCVGRMTADEKTYIPESEFPKVYLRARIYLLVYTGVVGLALYSGSILPLMYVGLPNLYGAWLMPIYGLTQHAGLAENVLDHRLNCRTVTMNVLNRYLYWNMNYHVEHHMFPLVPYHALPQLHAVIKDDTPPPYRGLIDAYREIIPAILRQVKDPGYYVRRRLPPPANQKAAAGGSPTVPDRPVIDGWIEVCAAAALGRHDVTRFDHAQKTYALYRTADGAVHATDGVCTHGNTHLADGLLKGNLIECPKHNGRFNITDGSSARAPACVGLRTYPVEERTGRLFLNLASPGGAGVVAQRTYRFRVVSNDNVATFIKELVLEPLDAAAGVAFAPGDYLQLDIPAYERIEFRRFDIRAPFADTWAAHHVFDAVAANPAACRRNYSIASNRQREKTLRFNVRIATPPPGQDCLAGAGSSYVFSLKPGDTVTAIGPFGDFHLKPTKKEMVYIGGGAGMAPLRAHLSHLFETEQTARRVSFWYGARSRQEIFYQPYFEELARRFPNFRFQLALSSPLPEDGWDSHVGFIHEVVHRAYLASHPNPKAVEYYLCGPPNMIKACNTMLAALGVEPAQIAYDEF